MTIISPLNPIKYVPLSPVEIPQYVSRHWDDWRFKDTTLPWEAKVCWNQPWLFQDTIRQQVISDVGPVRLRLIDMDDRVWYDEDFQQKQRIITMPDMFVYESSLALSVVTKPGIYYLRLDIGDDESNAQISTVNLYLSNNIESSVNIKHKTLLLEYRHPSYYVDTFFETGISFSLRVPGIIKQKSASAKTTTWEDQGLKMKMVKRMPFSVLSWVIGSSAGAPPWLVYDMINDILGCAELKLDGRQYTVNGGAEFEETTAENYPLRGFQIEMRDELNRRSRVIDSGEASRGPITVIANTDSKGFGMDAGNSSYQILDIG